MSVFESIPKNVVINHIVPHLTYKQRTKLYSTCKHFWSMKTNEYIFGRWPDCNYQYLYDIVHTVNKQETGYTRCSVPTGRSYGYQYDSEQDIDIDYFRKNESRLKRKLESYWKQFGVVAKKQKK